MRRGQTATGGPMINPFELVLEQLDKLDEAISKLAIEIEERRNIDFAEELCTPKEAAQVLRCSVSHVHTLRQQGLISYVRPELKVYRKSDLLSIGKE